MVEASRQTLAARKELADAEAAYEESLVILFCNAYRDATGVWPHKRLEDALEGRPSDATSQVANDPRDHRSLCGTGDNGASHIDGAGRVRVFRMSMNAAFGVRLIAARERRDHTQASLAMKAKMNPSQIAHFESGSREPSAENIRKLAIALDVSSDYLLGLRSDTGRIQDYPGILR